ncbi:unnamed protein product [Meloidogyne enterolobii]|uniref:Uncharacterized protein n=1 Tax=Meloidogyne enterolobii TaxID=390850 RepID=A0ACB0Z180_MELEN
MGAYICPLLLDNFFSSIFFFFNFSSIFHFSLHFFSTSLNPQKCAYYSSRTSKKGQPSPQYPLVSDEELSAYFLILAIFIVRTRGNRFWKEYCSWTFKKNKNKGRK